MQGKKKPSSFVSIQRDSSHLIKFQITKLRLSILIHNFGNDGGVKLTIEGRRSSGRAVYFKGSLFFSTVLKPDGEWSGRLVKKKRKEKVVFGIKKGRVSHRKIGELSKILQGDSNVIIDQSKDRGPYDSKGKGGLLQVKLMISSKHKMFGFIKHTSAGHYTRIDLKADGIWNAKGWLRLTGGKFLFSAERGKCSFDFKGSPLLIPT